VLFVLQIKSILKREKISPKLLKGIVFLIYRKSIYKQIFYFKITYITVAVIFGYQAIG